MILCVAATPVLTNFAPGALVKFGIVDTTFFRWLHHGLSLASPTLAGTALIFTPPGSYGSLGG